MGRVGNPSRTGQRPVLRCYHRAPITDYRSPITDHQDGSETHPTLLDIEPVDARAGGYTWTDADGSLLIRPEDGLPAVATRERIWRDVDAKADLLERVLADLVLDLASAWR